MIEAILRRLSHQCDDGLLNLELLLEAATCKSQAVNESLSVRIRKEIVMRVLAFLHSRILKERRIK